MKDMRKKNTGTIHLIRDWSMRKSCRITAYCLFWRRVLVSRITNSNLLFQRGKMVLVCRESLFSTCLLEKCKVVVALSKMMFAPTRESPFQNCPIWGILSNIVWNLLKLGISYVDSLNFLNVTWKVERTASIFTK